jgi:cell pole-organizing protein PopZ
MTGMSQAAKAQEPSMEEILASIRRIIADDEAAKPAKPPEPAPAPVAAVTPVSPPRPAPAPAAPRPVAPVPPLAEAKPEPVPVLPPLPEPAPEPIADVLDLTEAMAAAPPPAPPSFRTIDGESDVVFADRPPDLPPAPAPEPQARAVEEARRQFASVPDRALLSAATANAVDNAFNSLAHTVLGNNARTLEDLVKEMLRPMLKSWLDDNLPGLVDRIVRAVIERVSRGR